MINKMPDNLLLKRDIHYSVYNDFGDSLQDLVCNIFYKMNEIINNVNEYNDYVDNTIKWIKTNGLKNMVIDEIQKMYEDGLFNDVISKVIFLDLRSAIEENNKNIKLIGNEINNIKNSIESGYLNVKYVGAIGDGVSDDTTFIEKALQISNTILLPFGTYKINKELVVPENSIISGAGSTILVQNNNNGFVLNSNTLIENINIASKNMEYNVKNSSIIVEGKRFEYKENITLNNVNVKNIGNYGVKLKFTKNVTINNSSFLNVGYAGIGCDSCEDVIIDKIIVDNVYGFGYLAYGVYFSRTESDSLCDYPHSKNCVVRNSIIKNITKWEGLDTHGCINITFENNTIINCKNGIILNNSDNGSQQGTFSPKNCLILNNVIKGFNEGYGILVEGNNTEQSEGVIISGNIVSNYGQKGVSTTGAIELHGNTKGCGIMNNTIINSSPFAIAITNLNNEEFIVNSNTILNTFDDSVNNTGGIIIRANNNNGSIINNNLVNSNLNLGQYNSERGIAISTGTTNNNIFISQNNNNFKVPYHNCESSNSHSLVLTNGIKFYSSTSSPEGKISAPVGSIYLQTNGSSGSVLYVKESGNDKTGWIGK